MARTHEGLLTRLQNDLADQSVSTAHLLQTCILLGGQSKSQKLRDWARQELHGYKNDDEIPVYRHVAGTICVDGIAGNNLWTGNVITPGQLPKALRDRGQNEWIKLTQGVAELEDATRTDKTSIQLSPYNPAAIAALMNEENPRPYQRYTALYWSVSRSALVNVVSNIRTALADIVAELADALPEDEDVPTKEMVDKATTRFTVTGDSNTITIVSGQSASQGAVVNVTGAATTSDKSSGGILQWIRDRKMIVGAATIVVAVAGVATWLEWNPFK
ncbi:hypothetical protein [Lentzea sp. NPDC060358]|uniref:AbiTii domain-containing protein n=1 Tax=Lentzea sp. NPDC060358 TaxID=3347103 RepID=UPI00364704B6